MLMCVSLQVEELPRDLDLDLDWIICFLFAIQFNSIVPQTLKVPQPQKVLPD